VNFGVILDDWGWIEYGIFKSVCKIHDMCVTRI